MTVVSINTCNFGSTGNIMLSISDCARKNGMDAYVCVPFSRSNKKKVDEHTVFIGNTVSKNLHAKLGYITGNNGCYSFFSTKAFIKKLEKLKPDIIHLHNLHNNYINLKLLFNYIKKNNVRVIWTLHDCWSFTGQCPHFALAKCEKWKTGCHHCEHYREYPASRTDKTEKMYRLKKEWFTGVKDLTVVTPSQWLANLVKESFLKEYPVKVINNGIELGIFKPTQSDFKEKYSLENKKIVLGVAFGWGHKKGLDVFIELSKRLSKDYKIVLVGTDDNTDKQLPDNIVSIHRTHNQRELAEIYTAADVFVNPTREDTYPTVNMESVACGTPVVTFRTGGSPEILDERCGSAVDVDDIDGLEREIIRICENSPYSLEGCLEKSKGFDKENKFREYIDAYLE